MKKKLAIFGLSALAFASIAYAAGVTAVDPTNAWAIGNAGNAVINAPGVGTSVNCTLKLSANVCAFYLPGGGANYALTTAHESGTKSYASSSADNRLYMQENSGGNGALGTDSTGGTVAKISAYSDTTTGAVDWTGWTAVK